MAKEYKLDFDGQSVTQTDYNSLGSQAGLSEDHIFAELFRLTPDAGTIARGVIPYAHATSGLTALIYPAGATGTVKVNAFRALLGSRTLVAAGGAANWQDARSGLSVADADTALATTIAIAANASGNPRWDGIYAAVTINANSTPVTRKVKNPGSGVVTDESVSVTKATSVSVAVVAGTPGATPAFPTTPSDGGSVYYITLGYVRVPNGFNASSTVAPKDVNTVAPVISLSRAMGVSTLQPANQSYKTGGTAISGTGTSAIASHGVNKWTGTTAQRPGCFIPPTMAGCEERIIAIDLADASNANWSHQTGAILDDSCDWRYRLFRWQASACAGNLGNFPWQSAVNSQQHFGSFSSPPGYSFTSGLPAHAAGVGNTFNNTFSYACALAAGGAGAQVNPAAGYNIATNAMATGTQVIVSTDSSGRLILTVVGAPLASFLIWITASAPYENP